MYWKQSDKMPSETGLKLPFIAPLTTPKPCLDAKFSLKFHYAKKRFPITSKCRHMNGVLNVDEIKN
jgi:hypothetical protein